jgi:hypothetical protein
VKTPVRLAAVASSVLLVAGFVAYRAGAFDRPKAEPEPAGVSGETASPGSQDAPIAGTPVTDPAMISGSKSAIFIVPPQPAAPSATTPAPKGPPAFIGGSKSLAPLIPPSPPAKSAAPADPK